MTPKKPISGTEPAYRILGLDVSATEYFYGAVTRSGVMANDETIPTWADPNRYPKGTIPLAVRELTPSEKLEKEKILHDQHQKELKRKLKGPRGSRWG